MNWSTVFKASLVLSIIGWKYKYRIKKTIVKTVIFILENKKNHQNFSKEESKFINIGINSWKSLTDDLIIYSEEKPTDFSSSATEPIVMATVIHSDGTETDIINDLKCINHRLHTIDIRIGDLYNLKEYESLQIIFSNGTILDITDTEKCVSI